MLYTSDAELMDGFRAGSEVAFREVYNRLASPLLYFAANIVQDRDQAEDHVASTFLKLYKSRQKMETYEHVRRWSYVITRNQCVDTLREHVKTRKFKNDIFLLGDSYDLEIDLEMLKSALLGELARGVLKLPAQRQKVIRLYFFENKSTPEIAEIMEINSQTVLNHKTRALDKLKKVLSSFPNRAASL